MWLLGSPAEVGSTFSGGNRFHVLRRKWIPRSPAEVDSTAYPFFSWAQVSFPRGPIALCLFLIT